LQTWTGRFAAEIAIAKYWQFEFFQQWQALRSYAHEHGIRVIGDIPIYVAHDSADVWANRELFCLEAQGNPIKVAGVPPDYFSATGQLWGNPIFNWKLLKSTGYKWWVERFRAAFRLYDIVRIDHFRGFEAYWEVPATESTALKGRWIKGPGAELFSTLQQELGELPIIAENLGVITVEVEQIRQQFGFPGMAILQFAFGNDPQGPSFRPHNYVRNLVAYTGTHDNDTTLGWWNSKGTTDSIRTSEDVLKEHVFARTYLGYLDDEPINWAMIRTVLASIADTAIIPLQDVLGLGTEARMNLPGTSRGNWRWRFQSGVLSPELAKRLRALNEAYDR
jgi:4-alpha-glucanotransferase